MNGKLVSTLLALSVLLSSGLVAGMPVAEQNSHLNAQEEGDADAEFGTAVVEVHQNDTATIPITLDGTDEATVEIGSEAVNFVLVATVTDGDGDGAVTLRFDTSKAETDQTSLWTDDSENADDSVTVQSKMAPDTPPLSIGSYALSLYLGNSTEDDSEVDVGTMLILEPETTTEETTTATSETTDKPMTTTDVVTEPKPTETTDDARGDVPGFGPVLVLVALAVTAMLVARR